MGGTVIAELERLQAAYGDQFDAPDLLRHMAASGKTFYGTNAVTPPGVGGRQGLGS